MNRCAHDIEALVRGFARGDIDDSQMTDWLRDVFENGLPLDSTIELALAMAASGEVIDWSDVSGPVVDKHSTGGVGDAVSLIAVPLAAACGVKVAKLSGRALGHTGGTIDKLECIPELRTDLSVESFKAQVDRIGCAIGTATAHLAPADKKLYDLRNRTGTVASIPLIAASVMSKKIAAGAPNIVLDVKYGRGAFMTSIDSARVLAGTMHAIGERAGKCVVTVITPMDEPLADSVGDALELDEALSVLEGTGGSKALRNVAVEVAGAMLEAAGLDRGPIENALISGAALEKFRAMVKAQGGSLKQFDRSWPAGCVSTSLSAGTITGIDSLRVGQLISESKSGRPIVQARRMGARFRRRVGSRVAVGDELLEFWLPDEPAGLLGAIEVGAA